MVNYLAFLVIERKLETTPILQSVYFGNERIDIYGSKWFGAICVVKKI